MPCSARLLTRFRCLWRGVNLNNVGNEGMLPLETITSIQLNISKLFLPPTHNSSGNFIRYRTV